MHSTAVDCQCVCGCGFALYPRLHCAVVLPLRPCAVCCAGPIISPLTSVASTDNRDSLVKVIYACLFDWLVKRINESIGEDTACMASIGLLDIYGFESFGFNDLEQFCINLANEKLQQHFNQHVFKWEQVGVHQHRFYCTSAMCSTSVEELWQVSA